MTRPAFRAWAARNPFTRPIARRRTRALFDLCAGFVYAQTLSACVSLDLFERLAAGPVALDALARATEMPALETLVRAEAGLDLLTLRHGQVSLGPLGAAMVGNAGVVAMIAHHRLLYADLADPVALLRGRGGMVGMVPASAEPVEASAARVPLTGPGPSVGTALGAYWAYARAEQPAGLEAGAVAPYSALMAASQPLVAAEILSAYPVRRHTRVLDVGGGEGAFLVAAAQTAPLLRGTVFDLPAVATRAAARFHNDGLSGRLDAVGGDVFQQAWPGGADLISLVRVVHDHDDGRALHILRAAYAALPPGGTLLLAEPMAGTHGAGGVGTYFSFYLLAMGSGQPRTRARLQAMLKMSGFADIRHRPTATPLLVSVLTARRPLRSV